MGQATEDTKEPVVAPVSEGASSRARSRAWSQPHVRRGALLLLAGGAVPFLIMASERHFRWSVPVGFFGCLVASFGILDLMGAFSKNFGEVAARTPAAALLRRLFELGVSSAALVAALSAAVSGVLKAPIVTAAVLVTSTFLWTTSALFRTARALGAWKAPDGTDPPLLRRYGFWLVTLTTVLYLPLLGSYSLSDPWETHYGEVAREMLARDDWISTWWAQDGWFWSKPILNFWTQGLSFSLFGVRYIPDEMLAGVAQGRFPQPEWAARLPVFIMLLVAVYALYRAVARVWGQRAGLLSGLALSTMPYWYLIGHQTMADMPYVAPLTAGMSLLLLGFHSDPDKEVATYEVQFKNRTLRLSAFHLLFAAIIVLSLPQLLYIATRNVTLHMSADVFGFRFHPDEFSSGSGGGNCGLPGNQECAPTRPTSPDFWPIHGAGLWALSLGLLLWVNRKERRVQRLYFIAGWLFVALAALGKGAPGLVLPLATLGAYVAATGRWRDLERIEIGSLVLLVCAVTLPWYVQMFARHGAPFIDRLIMHDMYKRAFVHVHDTNSGDDVSFRYYVWQLGYGLFPWTGLSAVGLLWWLRRGERKNDRQADASMMLFLWFISAFGMFTITLTKFHHYIFPLVPPTAVFVGVLLDRLLGPASPANPGKLARYLAGMGAGALLLVYGVFRMFPRAFDGTEPSGDPPSRVWAYACLVLGATAVTFSALAYGRRLELSSADQKEAIVRRFEDAALSAAAVISAVSAGLAGRDLIVKASGDVQGQIRLMQLFTYNYTRPWPKSLDFTGAFVAFTTATIVFSLLLCVRRFRPHAATLVCAAGVLWGAWGVNVYLYKLSPHWGQRETILEYYRQRGSPQEPIVAYQMNWKGENFYTGNKIPAFVSSGQKFKDWIQAQKDNGVRVIYFTTEHGRMGSLKRELGEPAKFEKVTDETLNNKFFLARVEF